MARARGAVQLTVDDWLQAGYTVLAEEGFRALELDEICRRLGVTKGSFYHHFSDKGPPGRADGIALSTPVPDP
ncbi:helix-turn-helix domain-containing protein [Nocardia sp. NPDC050799]|uniref:TetR/AcrR family transcriptional regulator n=1 Tax=Nocardia sp. NPDC050799 TaxID=3154842 RepID=UPI0033C5780F